MSIEPRKMLVRRVLNMALDRAMKEDPKVILIGEDIGPYGGCFGVTQGLLAKYGPDRVIDTPISEGGIMGASIGLALSGYKPILEVMFMDFSTQMMDQLLNQALKIGTMYGSNIRIPLVLRAPAGGYRAYGATHSQSLENIFASFHDLEIIYPYTADDYYNGMLWAIKADKPVLFMEHKNMYYENVEFNEPEIVSNVRIKSRILEQDPENKVLVISSGWMTKYSVDIAKETHHTVLNMPTLKPTTDLDIILDAIKAHKITFILQESSSFASIAEHIAYAAHSLLHNKIQNPVTIISGFDKFIPFAPDKERQILPDPENIRRLILESRR